MQRIENKKFTPKLVHILLAVAAVVVLSVFIFSALSGGGDRQPYFDFGVKDKPVGEADFLHIFSGNYEGKSILVTVKSVKNESGRLYLIYDLKCDFIPVASECKCLVSLSEQTYDFRVDRNAVRDVPLGSGTFSRTSAGKIVFQPSSSGKIDLLQL